MWIYSKHCSVEDEGAVDSVDRSKLWQVLGSKGLQGDFLRSLQRLYDNDFVVTEVAGVSTKPVYLGRGLRQGCSLSPILFALYIADMSWDISLSLLGVKLYRVLLRAGCDYNLIKVTQCLQLINNTNSKNWYRNILICSLADNS